MDDLGSVAEALAVADPVVSRSATSLQQSLDDVQRSSQGSCESSSKSTRDTVSRRVVSLAGVEKLAQGVVRCELNRGERDGHREGCRVRDVEGLESLAFVDSSGAVTDRLVGRSVNLHTLLHDVKGVHERIARSSCTRAGETSNERVMFIADISSKVVFHALVRSEVDGVSRACSRNSIRSVDPSDKARGRRRSREPINTYPRQLQHWRFHAKAI